MYKKNLAPKCFLPASILCFSIFLMIGNSIGQVNQSADLVKLEQRLFQAYKNKAYAEALKIAERMQEIKPGDVDTLYNLAIVHTKLGNKKKAQEWFNKAIEAGGLRSFRKAYYERYAAMLEHKDRDAYQMPEKVMEALAFKPGERVADIGAGSGYFTIRIAKAVGSSGLVWAIDVEQFLLDYI